jgi:hypothetical protein
MGRSKTAGAVGATVAVAARSQQVGQPSRGRPVATYENDEIEEESGDSESEEEEDFTTFTPTPKRRRCAS